MNAYVEAVSLGLNLSTRAEGVLERFPSLRGLTIRDLKRAHNCGPKTTKEIVAALASLGTEVPAGPVELRVRQAEMRAIVVYVAMVAMGQWAKRASKRWANEDE